MPVIGVNYTKIDAQRTGNSNQKLNLSTTPNIKDFKKAEMEGFDTKKEIAQVGFEFKTSIKPDIGHITIEGIILYEHKDLDSLEEQWNNKGTLPEDANMEILNYVLRNTSIKALQMSEMLQLPPIVNLPKVTKKGESDKKEE